MFKKLIISLAIRIIISVPIFLLGWFIISGSTSWSDILRIMGGVFIMICPAFIVAPPIAQCIGDITGSSLFPGNGGSGEIPPGFSKPQALRMKGLYKEAIGEYDTMLLNYPQERRIYMEMLAISIVDLHDRESAEDILKIGLSQLKDGNDRKCLKEEFNSLLNDYRPS